MKLTPSGAATGGQFGYSVGVTGNMAIVGSPYDTVGEISSGSVRLFDVATGQEVLKLTPTDATSFEWFGLDVGLSGNRAIVGAPNDGATSPFNEGPGAAYLFDVGTGDQLFKLTVPDAAAGDRFGQSVAISGHTAIVGTVGDKDAGDYSGAAYLFDVSTGQELYKLTASDAAPMKMFGRSVAISGNVAIVGAEPGCVPGTDPGSAYLFNVTTGEELFKLTPSDSAAGDQFGVAVDISGNLAVVGAVRDDDFATNSGSAYVFDVTTGQQLLKLRAADPAAHDQLGGSVAIRGNLAVIGANSNAGAGAAYFFDLTTGKQLAKVTATDAEVNDAFGFSVAAGENMALIGAAYDDGYTGSAYVISTVPEPASTTLLALVLPLIFTRRRRIRTCFCFRSRIARTPGNPMLTLIRGAPFKIAILSAMATVVVVGMPLAKAAPGDIHNLGTLGGTSSTAYDINHAGQVVGSALDAAGRSRAFLWHSSHGMSDLGTLSDYTEARAHAISASGSVVGVEFGNGAGTSHAFAWIPNEPNGTTGVITDLATDDSSQAMGVNAAGDVVGYSLSAYFVPDDSCTPDHPYYPNCGPGGYWAHESRPVQWKEGVSAALFAPGTASAINDAGQVVGVTDAGRAFRYDGTAGSGGTVHDLGTLGGLTSNANAINSAGQVVGGSATSGYTGEHAFLYTGTPGVDGMMVDLGTVGGTFSLAYDINDSGFIVGLADRTGGGTRAILWLNDSARTPIDLDVWLDAVNPTLGSYWDLAEARGVNSNGLITGEGIYDDGPGGLTDGNRAFLLDASPLIIVSPSVPGDYNGDGAVNAADYAVWRNSLGQLGAGLAADGNRDMIVNEGDYELWKINFGRMAGDVPVTTATVPEPSRFVLLIISGLVANFLALRRVPHAGAQTEVI